MPLPSPVAGAAHAADHGVNAVAVALGVGQAFEHKGGGALAHDKPVGAAAKGAGAGGAERADLAEFHKGADAHVAIHAAGDHRVDLLVDQHFHRRLDGGEAGGAGGVGDEVRPAQIEHVGHASGDDVGQLAGHGVFGDGRVGLVDVGMPGGQDRLARGARQPGELRHGGQGMGIFGKDDALIGDEGAFAAHGRAEDDGGWRRVQRPLRIAIVGECVGADGHRPLLPLVHGLGHARRDAEAAPVESKPAHPAADFAVGFVRCGGVGVIIIGGSANDPRIPR